MNVALRSHIQCLALSSHPTYFALRTGHEVVDVLIHERNPLDPLQGRQYDRTAPPLQGMARYARQTTGSSIFHRRAFCTLVACGGGGEADPPAAPAPPPVVPPPAGTLIATDAAESVALQPDGKLVAGGL